MHIADSGYSYRLIRHAFIIDDMIKAFRVRRG